MQKSKILLCVSGGIAAYKAIDLASQLIKLGFSVRCVLTSNARKFVSPLNFAAITHERVYESLYEDADPIPHITLADWADLVVVAPATANIMAKAAQGIADDLMSTLLLAHRKPVLYIPAMNVFMFESIPTQENIRQLLSRGHHVLKPATGMLACGYVGSGKYPPNAEVIAAINTYLDHQEDLHGKKVLVTAGATIEAIDPMRYISNRSSGKMGLAIARALALRGAEVCLIYGNITVDLPYYLQETIFCETAKQMHKAVMERAEGIDWIIKCAAVADYAPAKVSNQKLPKSGQMNLELKGTKDILLELGKIKKHGQNLIGFAAQTDDMIDKAVDKYIAKQLDMSCVNHISNAGQDENELNVIGKLPAQQSLKGKKDLHMATLKGDKLVVANALVDLILQL